MVTESSCNDPVPNTSETSPNKYLVGLFSGYQAYQEAVPDAVAFFIDGFGAADIKTLLPDCTKKKLLNSTSLSAALLASVQFVKLEGIVPLNITNLFCEPEVLSASGSPLAICLVYWVPVNIVIAVSYLVDTHYLLNIHYGPDSTRNPEACWRLGILQTQAQHRRAYHDGLI